MMMLKLKYVDLVDVHDSVEAALVSQQECLGLLFAPKECFVGQSFGRQDTCESCFLNERKTHTRIFIQFRTVIDQARNKRETWKIRYKLCRRS
jgi:hypothetical protein